MKLVRFGPKGKEKTGLLSEKGIHDASKFFKDFDEKFFTKNGLAKLQKKEAEILAQPAIDLHSVRLGSPFARPSKIICIGLNYADHAKESGMDLPKEPIIFFKATTAISGPNDQVIIPKNSEKTDWEVELAVVIGKEAKYVTEKNALKYVAGYCLHNDVSEREWQLERGGQWVKGKSADTFAPMGPFLATQDEISDVNNLHVYLDLNGKRLQNSNTSNLVFKIPMLVSYLSQFMTLLPGDVISTGTPAGVGLGFKPPFYLQPGDVMELGIEGLGTAKQIAEAD